MVVTMCSGEGTEEEAHQGHQVQEPRRAEGSGGGLSSAVLAEIHQQSKRNAQRSIADYSV